MCEYARGYEAGCATEDTNCCTAAAMTDEIATDAIGTQLLTRNEAVVAKMHTA